MSRSDVFLPVLCLGNRYYLFLPFFDTPEREKHEREHSSHWHPCFRGIAGWDAGSQQHAGAGYAHPAKQVRHLVV